MSLIEARPAISQESDHSLFLGHPEVPEGYRATVFSVVLNLRRQLKAYRYALAQQRAENTRLRNELAKAREAEAALLQMNSLLTDHIRDEIVDMAEGRVPQAVSVAPGTQGFVFSLEELTKTTAQG